MISCFWVLALLVGVWGQSWPLTNVTVGASNASFVITTVSGVANVTATFAATTPFQWISIGFSTGNMASGGDGSDMFMCESDNTVGRYWVTSQSISAAGKVAVAGGSCSTSTVAGISRKTIHFERAVTATAQQRSLANSTAILLAFGNYPLVAHAATNRVPTPVTFTAPTPAPPGQVEDEQDDDLSVDLFVCVVSSGDSWICRRRRCNPSENWLELGCSQQCSFCV